MGGLDESTHLVWQGTQVISFSKERVKKFFFRLCRLKRGDDGTEAEKNVVSSFIVVCIGCGIILAFLRDEFQSARSDKTLFGRPSSVYVCEISPEYSECVRGTPLGV